MKRRINNMSTLTKICFDASVHEGFVGIGIYNFDTQEEIIHRYKANDMDSTTAETMALVKTLHYMKERNITKAHLFTDNQAVAKKGISNKLSKNISASLTWIPREFNVDADRLSKRAHLLKGVELGISGRHNRGTAHRITQRNLEMNDPVIIERKREERALKANIPQIKNLKSAVKQYPLSARINILKKFNNSEFTDTILRTLTEGTIALDSADYRKDDRMFLKTYLSLIDRSECRMKAFMDVIKKQYIKKQHSECSLNSALCDLG